MISVQQKKIGASKLNWIPLSEKILSTDEIYESWKSGLFSFKEENLSLSHKGLRPPQLGGIYSALGFEKSDSESSATIVMPTGTGKTETILSILIAGKFKKTLIIVPSDALRKQTEKKLFDYKLLREFGVIDDSIANPRVATINHGINDNDEIDSILDANVLVASAAALARIKDDQLLKITQSCSHLIIDEAHHVTAETWSRVKKNFKKNNVFQFTATPFRTDRSRIEGKIIFNYPLRKAQEDGYFKKIEFHPIIEFMEENADIAIAEKAINLLEEDLQNGFNHIMMARANTIERAKEIFEIYSKSPHLNPVIINSKTKQKQKILEDIKNGNHKIIVCVDMLGEGFDLPQLKISAIHDPHKSINIMLQFTGRFTRTTDNVGNAKFVANIANPNVSETLDELYRENSDWNNLISNISSRKIQDEKNYEAFISEFSNKSKLLDLGLNPNISTVIYSMKVSEWKPDEMIKFGRKNFNIFDTVISDEKDFIIISVKTETPVGWASSKELQDETWDLYIAYYNKKDNLLYIHSSAKDGLTARLVKLIAPSALKIQGERIFRTFHGIKRLKLQNVGLNKNKKGLRYSMHTGTEINDQIPDIEAKRATKSNIFGKGFESGVAVSIGCSYKGKIWSMDSDSIEKWKDWCNKNGSKVLDDTIDTNTVMKTAMHMEELESLPNIAALNIEWPAEILRKNDSKIIISNNNHKENLLSIELEIRNSSYTEKQVSFFVKARDFQEEVSLHLISKGQAEFKCSEDLTITISESVIPLSEFFNEFPPVLFLADTSFIDGGLRVFPHENYEYRYDVEKIEYWDWHGIDLSKESQTEFKNTDTVQWYTINKIKDDYDFIFDDDGSGEVADIVAIKNINDVELVIDLYHCKYCPKINGVSKPGARIDDVYQVVGQAIKSIKWFSDKEKLILRLIDREKARLFKGMPSRIDKGNLSQLIHYAKVARFSAFRLGIAIVQPAISKKLISNEQLILLGSTESYIDEVTGVKLRAFVSD